MIVGVESSPCPRRTTGTAAKDLHSGRKVRRGLADHVRSRFPLQAALGAIDSVEGIIALPATSTWL